MGFGESMITSVCYFLLVIIVTAYTFSLVNKKNKHTYYSGPYYIEHKSVGQSLSTETTQLIKVYSKLSYHWCLNFLPVNVIMQV